MEADTDITSPSSVLGEALQNAARITTLPSITPSGTSEKTLASGVREYFLELAPDFIYHKALDTLPWHLFPCLDSFVVDSGVNRATKAVITPSAAQEATIVLDTSYAIWTTCSTNKLWLPPRSILHTAKICMVLQIMHRADLMHSFLAAGKTDASLPMIEDDLVHIIGHTSSAREFHTEQKRALVRDIPSDHHVDFAEEDLVPLRSSGYLGTGACGVVDIVQNVFSGSILARKVLTPVKRERRLLKRFFDSEISSLRKLKSHQHIVQYVGSYTRGASLALLLLPVADCSLREFLAGSRNPLDRDRNSHILFRCFGCLASALAYMHDHRIRHKDIKPGNILIHNSNVLFTDFGLAFDFSQSTSTTTYGVPQARTKKYAAPEVMECQKRGRRSDVYSLGCVFLEITTVLAGESLTALEEFLDKDNYDDEDDAGGECEVEYHQSLEKVTSWIERISVIDKDNKIHLPVQWCSQMLQRGADRRPYMNDLIQTVAKDTRPERDTQLLYFCPTCLEELQLRREITNEMTLNCMMEPSDAASDLDIEEDDSNLSALIPVKPLAKPQHDADGLKELNNRVEVIDFVAKQPQTPLQSNSRLSPAVLHTRRVFSTCISYYELFACISCLPAEKEWLRIRVELELIRLLDWSDIMGIVQQDSTLTLDFRVYQPTILNILVQQRSILYMLREDLFSASTDGMDSSTNRAGGAHLRYFPEGSHTLLEKVLLDPTEGGLHHFVRNHDCSSFEVAKLEASLPKLIELNDSLRNQMDGPLWGILQQREEQTNLELLQLYNNTEVLANLEWALSIDTKGGHQTIDDANLPGLRDKSALIQFIRFKAYNAKVEIINADEKSQRFFSVEAGAGTVDELLLDRDDFTFSQERSLDHERSEAFYCPSGQPGQRVWIEWKEYDGIPPKFGPNPAVLRRVQELAALLHYDNRPRDLGTARCLGYFINDFEAMDEGMETETCFGLAFERPPEAPVDGELIPLWELYESHSKPSATTRIELAKTIANCILYLHSTNWLHKGLTSKVILYFEEPGKPLDYKGSYLSGFDYARPAASEEMTENPPEDPTIDIYRHPSTHGAAPRTNYMKTFDIYSLGIILVEIAHWQSIDKVMGIPDLVTARPQVIHKTRRRLLNETQFLDNISGALGETYKEVVRTCLIGPTAFDLYETARQHDGRVGAKLIGEYFTKVVQRLRGITNL